ncbi:hypothetical protein HNR46_003515 [Haloferula luteola]|uniref:Uncharacterized protein n=1 Tax=Haloferula luteola TaxID=595692 RepID=A0A840VHE4_9BACT|nr:hypothetical protein [Haloferula luteola]MBB5353260.1 hypothetical protein [Haloferula luteola]
MFYEIIELLRAPFEAAKRSHEDSTVGPSEWDRRSMRFWKWFAWIGTGVVVGIPMIGWIGWKLLTH